MTQPDPSFALGDRARADMADAIDRQLSPLGLAAIAALAPSPGETVLDIGCGAGQTLLQIAARVGPAGRVIGVDIAPHVLAVARARTAGLPQISLIRGDAAALALPAASVDAVYARFGMMAIDDPLAAFAGFRRMLRPGGRLAFTCWRQMAENELDWLPLRAAGLEERADPTPFRFARADDVAGMLAAAGFGAIGLAALDRPVSCGDLDTTMAVVTTVGALGKILREAPDLRAAARPRVRAALAPRVTGEELWLNAAIWVVTATA